MSYTTKFSGKLSFVNELKAKQLAKIKFFIEDSVLELTEDFSGLEIEETVNHGDEVPVFINDMLTEFPDILLEGYLVAQGEDLNDLWKVVIIEGKAERINFFTEDGMIECPHCKKQFKLGF